MPTLPYPVQFWTSRSHSVNCNTEHVLNMHIISIHKGSCAIVMIHETNARVQNFFYTLVHFQTPRSERKKRQLLQGKEKKTCQRWDSNPRPHTWTRMLRTRTCEQGMILESGALDHSATLTARLESAQIAL